MLGTGFLPDLLNAGTDCSSGDAEGGTDARAGTCDDEGGEVGDEGGV